MIELPANYSALTWDQRRKVRERYIRIQGDLCYLCKASLDGPPAQEVQAKPVNKWLFPDGFFDRPVHLHHSHVTGLTLGAVHAHCNAVLWQYYGE